MFGLRKRKEEPRNLEDLGLPRWEDKLRVQRGCTEPRLQKFCQSLTSFVSYGNRFVINILHFSIFQLKY